MVPNRTIGVLDASCQRVKNLLCNVWSADKPALAMASSSTRARATVDTIDTRTEEENGEVIKKIADEDHGPLGQHFLTLFHTGIVLYYISVDIQMFSSSAKLKHTGHPVTKMFLGGVTQFFTDWNQAIHQTYFAACLAHDILGYSTDKRHLQARKTLRHFRHCMFGPVLMPATCLTVVNFWSFYLAAPQLMLDDLVAFYPSVLNHAMHTYIAPLVYAEMVLVPQPKLPRRLAVRFVTALMGCYSGWIYLLGILTGQWPYKFLEVMNVCQHAIFIPCMFMHGYLWYFINDYFITKIWGHRRKEGNEIVKND